MERKPEGKSEETIDWLSRPLSTPTCRPPFRLRVAAKKTRKSLKATHKLPLSTDANGTHLET